jgi:hypothetical protein
MTGHVRAGYTPVTLPTLADLADLPGSTQVEDPRTRRIYVTVSTEDGIYRYTGPVTE